MLDRRLTRARLHQPHRVHANSISINFNIDMRKQIPILIVAVALGTSAAIAEQTEHEKQKYTCVMHPEVVMDHPGKCPKCGTTLVPLKLKSQRPTSNVQRSTSDPE
jgi:Heavy metal binding domain